LSPSLKYGTAGVLLVGVITLGLWPFLGDPARSGVLTGALIALPVQVVAFSVLVRFRGRTTGFMAAWAGGMALRAAAVVIAAVVVVRSGTPSAVSLLLALAGFFFALLLLEPLYFKADLTKQSELRGVASS
jgi:hypothetical protein